MKYIDAERLKAEIERRKADAKLYDMSGGDAPIYDELLSLITSLQQDKEVLDLCSQVWWEDRGWIMISPNVTLKGIESLLERVRHKIKWNKENGIKEQEQPEVDLEKAIEAYFKGWHIEEEIGLTKPDGWSCIVDDLKDIARHFYKLGLNARK